MNLINLSGFILALFALIYAVTLGRRIRDLNRKLGELLKESGKDKP